jgi:hypothetical protein
MVLEHISHLFTTGNRRSTVSVMLAVPRAERGGPNRNPNTIHWATRRHRARVSQPMYAAPYIDSLFPFRLMKELMKGMVVVSCLVTAAKKLCRHMYTITSDRPKIIGQIFGQNEYSAIAAEKEKKYFLVTFHFQAIFSRES